MATLSAFSSSSWPNPNPSSNFHSLPQPDRTDHSHIPTNLPPPLMGTTEDEDDEPLPNTHPQSTLLQNPNPNFPNRPSLFAPTILHVSFNQDYGCFATGTDRGFKIYNCDPFREIFRRDFHHGGIGTVEMLFRCNILAIVGGGPDPQYPLNKVMIWDDHQSRCIGELSFRSEVRGVQLRRDRIAVVLEQKIFVYNFSDLKLLHQIETIANPKGLCAVSQAGGSLVLVCPGLQKGQVRVEHYASKRTKFIMAHDSRIACFALTPDGHLLATCSTKGTLVRIFNTFDGSLLQELRYIKRRWISRQGYSKAHRSALEGHSFSYEVPQVLDWGSSMHAIAIPNIDKQSLVKITSVTVQGCGNMTQGGQFFYGLLSTEGIDLKSSALRRSIRKSFLFNEGLENNVKILFHGVVGGDFTRNTVFKSPIRKFRKARYWEQFRIRSSDTITMDSSIFRGFIITKIIRIFHKSSSTLRDHYQGFISFTNVKRPGAVKDFLGSQTVHLTNATGSDLQNKVYCSKEGYVIFELGEPVAPGQHKRKRIQLCEEDPESAKIEYPDMYNRYICLQKRYADVHPRHPWQNILMEYISGSPDHRSIYWIYSPDGGEDDNTTKHVCVDIPRRVQQSHYDAIYDFIESVRRGADSAEIYTPAFSSTAQWLAVSSDKGTVHVFGLKANLGNLGSDKSHGASDPNHAVSSHTSSLSFIKGVLPKYFSSEWSVAEFRLLEGSQYIVAFGHQKNTVVILGLDGSFYRCQFDPVSGGEMTQLEYHNFLKPEEAFLER
ncbi:unnamed protein product [Camellia sinensis]